MVFRCGRVTALILVCVQTAQTQERPNSWLSDRISKPVRIADGSSPSYSPDGKRIILSRGNGRGDSSIGIMEANGSNAKFVVGKGTNIEPSFSPDGQKITYVSLADDKFDEWNNLVHWTIVVSKKDGSSVRVVNKPGTDGSPQFTPDGLSLSFLRSGKNPLSPTTALYLLNLKTGKETKLVDFKHSTSACYDAERRRVAFTKSEEKTIPIQVHLYVMNVDGTNLRKITTTGVSSHPSFSKDGEWLTFSLNNTIAVARSQGSQIRQMTQQSYEGPYAQYPKFSPDGKHILFENFHGLTKGVSDICRISLVR